MRRSLATLAAGILVTVLIASGAVAAGSGPDSRSQPIVDGCQRSNGMYFAQISPEWVYVDKAAVLQARAAGDDHFGSRTVEGTVHDIHPAGDDLFITHDFNDIDTGVLPDPDPKFQELVASGNGEGLGTEWETVKIPPWAWPTTGDAVRESGSWIWDCGHWGQRGDSDPTGLSQFLPYDPIESARDALGSPALSGEQTELHPLYEVATWRHDWAAVLQGQTAGRNVQHLDVWINGDGGPALAEEECALYGNPSTVLDRLLCKTYRDVGGTYSYELNVGPAPSGSSAIIVNAPEVHEALIRNPLDGEETASGVVPAVSTGTDGSGNGIVTVSFTLPHTVDATGMANAIQHFGMSVDASWSDAPLAVHHTVSIDSFKVFHSLDRHSPTDAGSEPSRNPVGNGPEQAYEPAEWVMYLNVSGRWMQVPGITQVSDGFVLDPGGGIHTFDFWLPQGATPHIYVSGRECDIPLNDCTRETYDGTADYAHPFGEIGYNDHPGRIGVSGTGIPMTLGSGVYAPNYPAVSNVEQNSEFTCNGPCYQIEATWSKP